MKDNWFWRIGMVTSCLFLATSISAVAETEMDGMQIIPDLGRTSVSKVEVIESRLVDVEENAVPEMSREEALEIAAEVLRNYAGVDIDKKEYQIGTEYRRDWQSPTSYVWSLHFHYSDPSQHVSAFVTLEASTGSVLDLHLDSSRYPDGGRNPLSLTKDEAQERAEELLRRLAPGKLEKSRNIPIDGYYGYGDSSVYHFQYFEEKEGILYDANFMNITIDGASGALRSFNYRWDKDAELPSPDAVISREEAESIFDQYTAVELFYLPMRDEFRYESIPKNFRIAYRLDQGMVGMIDAHSGKPVDWAGKEETTILQVDISDKRKSEIVDKAKKPTALHSPLKQFEAEEKAGKIVEEIIGESIQIKNSQYSQGDGLWESAGRKVWNMNFVMETHEEEFRGTVMLDAETGSLIA